MCLRNKKKKFLKTILFQLIATDLTAEFSIFLHNGILAKEFNSRVDPILANNSP